MAGCPRERPPVYRIINRRIPEAPRAPHNGLLGLEHQCDFYAQAPSKLQHVFNPPRNFKVVGAKGYLAGQCHGEKGPLFTLPGYIPHQTGTHPQPYPISTHCCKLGQEAIVHIGFAGGVVILRGARVVRPAPWPRHVLPNQKEGTLVVQRKLAVLHKSIVVTPKLLTTPIEAVTVSVINDPEGLIERVKVPRSTLPPGPLLKCCSASCFR